MLLMVLAETEDCRSAFDAPINEAYSLLSNS